MTPQALIDFSMAAENEDTVTLRAKDAWFMSEILAGAVQAVEMLEEIGGPEVIKVDGHGPGSDGAADAEVFLEYLASLRDDVQDAKAHFEARLDADQPTDPAPVAAVDETAPRVRELAARWSAGLEALGYTDADEIPETALLREDLGLDSLDQLSVLMDIHETLRIDLDPDAMETINTLGELIAAAREARRKDLADG